MNRNSGIIAIGAFFGLILCLITVALLATAEHFGLIGTNWFGEIKW